MAKEIQPDPSEENIIETPPDKPTSVSPAKPEISSVTVVSDRSVNIVKKLQTRIAALEDEINGLKERNESYEMRLQTLKGVPSRTNPAKQLLDELEEFLNPKEISVPAKATGEGKE